MKIAINGFGRIGRTLFRINLKTKKNQICAINDIYPNKEHMVYLLKYDSTYGNLNENIKFEENKLKIDSNFEIPIFNENNIINVPWESMNIDIIIDTSGVKLSRNQINILKKRGIKHIICTQNFNNVDKIVIFGVNENTIEFNEDIYISSSICDAIAIAPVIALLTKKYIIRNCSITSLHPWLQYQNLLDGKCNSLEYPGDNASHFQLGRSSVNALIPKQTSIVNALEKVFSFIKNNYISFSYRVPTSIVSSADLVIQFNEFVNKSDIIDLFKEFEKNQTYKIIKNNFEPLISVDLKGSDYSVIIDQRWIQTNGSFLKMILWYDNEWGYSSRVLDIVECFRSRYENTNS